MPRTTADYMSGPHDGEKCGCRHNDREWTNRCAAAAANDLATSAQWAADHIRQNPSVQFTSEYEALARGGKSIQPSNDDLR